MTNVSKFNSKKMTPPVKPMEVSTSKPPQITYSGVKDGESSISMTRYHEALRAERTVKGIMHNLKHMEYRELLKLRKKLDLLIAKHETE